LIGDAGCNLFVGDGGEALGGGKESLRVSGGEGIVDVVLFVIQREAGGQFWRESSRVQIKRACAP